MISSDLPLIDLHHHLDGSVRLETILDIGLKYGLALPATTLEGLRPFVQVSLPKPGVMAFIEKFEWMTGILVNYDVCRRVAYEVVEDAAHEGIDYIELRYSPWFMALAHQLDPQGVIEAVSDGIHSAEHSFKIKVNQIGILSRHYGPETAWKEFACLLACKDQISGLDLAGDEAHYPGSLFVEHFKCARDAGWHVTIHAGEAAGPESVWQAINELGAERIGHAVHAPEDSALMVALRERKIGIECNLTSNVQTSSVASYAVHPLKLFLEQGLLATLNTDDPGISAIDLHYEYDAAAGKAGLSEAMMRQAQKNALTTAFLSQDEKKTLLQRKERV